jgi:Skp family chaperone for outer membrane proteins
MKRQIAAVLLFAAAIPAVAAMQSRSGPATLAFASMRRISAESTAAQAWAKKVQALREEKAKDLTEKQKAFESKRLELAQSGGLFQGTKRAELEKETQQAEQDLRSAREQAQADMQTLQRQVDAQFGTEMNRVLVDVAKEHGVDAILNRDTTVLWSRDGLDVTEDVVKRLNASGAGDKK